jgi:hypothetical protein
MLIKGESGVIYDGEENNIQENLEEIVFGGAD